jgi:hypothetical protein
MTKSITMLAAAAAFSSLAAAQGVGGNADLFTSRATEIAARSAESCDQSVDVPALSAKRAELLELREVRAPDAMSTFRHLAFANAAKLSICWDTRLAGSGYESAQYLGLPRIIALNPDYAAQAPAVLMRSLVSMKQRFEQAAAGSLTEAALAAPAGLTPTGSVADIAKLPRQAPHSKPDYRLDATQR